MLAKLRRIGARIRAYAIEHDGQADDLKVGPHYDFTRISFE